MATSRRRRASSTTRSRSKFAQLAAKLRRGGYSADSARRIAASIGDRKYGKTAMARKSAAAHRRNAARGRRR